jgi:hypothetical protein
MRLFGESFVWGVRLTLAAFSPRPCCLRCFHVQNTGWWTYKFCANQRVTQARSNPLTRATFDSRLTRSLTGILSASLDVAACCIAQFHRENAPAPVQPAQGEGQAAQVKPAACVLLCFSLPRDASPAAFVVWYSLMRLPVDVALSRRQ